MPLGGPRFGGPTGGPQNKTAKTPYRSLSFFYVISKIRAAALLFPITIAGGLGPFGATEFLGFFFSSVFRLCVFSVIFWGFIGLRGGLFFFHVKKYIPNALRGIGNAICRTFKMWKTVIYAPFSRR